MCNCCCNACMHIGGLCCFCCCTSGGKCNDEVGCCNECCGWFKKFCSCFYNCFSNCWENVYTVIRLIKKWVIGTHFDLYQYVFYIVTQYYELYVIGISKNIKYEIPDIINALKTTTETKLSRHKQNIGTCYNRKAQQETALPTQEHARKNTFLDAAQKVVPRGTILEEPTTATGI